MLSDPLPNSDNTVPSSQDGGATFSDDSKRASSPPSSPPCFPWELPDEPAECFKTLQRPSTNNAFSILGKRKALDTISDNAYASKKARTTSVPAKTAVGTRALTQMQISLGQEVQKLCKTCGMEYIASSAEDRKLHDKYHKQNTEGYDVGKEFVQKARSGTVFEGSVKGDFICAVDCLDKPARKGRAQAVLEVVQRELGAVEIPQDEIWDAQLLRGEGSKGKYTAYLYVRGTKCIGFLLVQEIREAYQVMEPLVPEEKDSAPDDDDPVKRGDKAAMTSLAALKERRRAAFMLRENSLKQPLKLSTKMEEAALGISRVWTSTRYRKHSIATTLLDTSVRHYNEAMARRESGNEESSEDDLASSRSPRPITHDQGDVAFSQPTEAGVRLARRWFGKIWGWPVYVD